MSRREILLLAACVALLVAAVFGPSMPQPEQYHSFADQRTLWGVPFAMDVLSNAPFAFAGVAGVVALLNLPAGALGRAEGAMAMLFCCGLVLVAAGSSTYHWQPDDESLALDRYAMSVAFAGLLGLAAATQVSERAGWVLGGSLLLLAPASVWTWSATGNVLPWAVVQFGGMALVLAMAGVPSQPGALIVRWGLVIAAYGAAKLMEVNDEPIYRLTSQWISGHTFKHLAAALAACPVILAVAAKARRSSATRLEPGPG
jgi:hypothetical protein